jgi:hypothetical protein
MSIYCRCKSTGTQLVTLQSPHCIHSPILLLTNLTKAQTLHYMKEYLICKIWGSHSGGYEEYYLLGYNAVSSVESQLTFRRKISPPSSGSKNKPSKKPAWKKLPSRVAYQLLSRRYIPEGGTLHNHRCENLISYIEAICSSETLVDTQRTTRRYIPEDSTLQYLIYFYVVVVR